MHLDVKERKSISPWQRRCYEDIDCYEYRVAMNTDRFDSYLAEFLRFVPEACWPTDSEVWQDPTQ
jgi:hypothetical protein